MAYGWCAFKRDSFCIIMPNFVETGHAVAIAIFRDCIILVKYKNSLNSRSYAIWHNFVIVTNDWMKFIHKKYNKSVKFWLKVFSHWEKLFRKPRGVKSFWVTLTSVVWQFVINEYVMLRYVKIKWMNQSVRWLSLYTTQTGRRRDESRHCAVGQWRTEYV